MPWHHIGRLWKQYAIVNPGRGMLRYAHASSVETQMDPNIESWREGLTPASHPKWVGHLTSAPFRIVVPSDRAFSVEAAKRRRTKTWSKQDGLGSVRDANPACFLNDYASADRVRCFRATTSRDTSSWWNRLEKASTQGQLGECHV